MKSHKNWSIAAMVCMCMTCISGFDMRSKETHKFWAFGACGCMAMAIYSGHKIIRPSKKKSPQEEAEKEAED